MDMDAGTVDGQEHENQSFLRSSIKGIDVWPLCCFRVFYLSLEETFPNLEKQ
jgi:hypothetical protein